MPILALCQCQLRIYVAQNRGASLLYLVCLISRKLLHFEQFPKTDHFGQFIHWAVHPVDIV